MALDVEAICNALAERLTVVKTNGVLRDVARRHRPQYTDAELPTLVVRDDEGQETLISDPDDPAPIWGLTAEIQVYARAVETDISPTSQLNALVKAVREALEFDADRDAGQEPSHYTTLGGRLRVLAVTRVEKGMGALTGTPSAQITVSMEAYG